MPLTNKPMFVEHLFTIVSDPNNYDIIRWRDDGGFTVMNSQLLAKRILPNYFNHDNYTSFVRQLSNYHFISLKEKREHELGPFSFRHENNLFQRDRHDLVAHIKRRKDNRRMRRVKDDGNYRGSSPQFGYTNGDGNGTGHMDNSPTSSDARTPSPIPLRHLASGDALQYAYSVIAEQAQRIATLKDTIASLQHQIFQKSLGQLPTAPQQLQLQQAQPQMTFAPPPPFYGVANNSATAASTSTANAPSILFDTDLALELGLLAMQTDCSTSSANSSPLVAFGVENGLLADS